jgi:hypothetical protein
MNEMTLLPTDTIRIKPGATLRMLFLLPEGEPDGVIRADALVLVSGARVPLEVRFVGEDFRFAEVTATAEQTADWPPWRHVLIDLVAELPEGDVAITPTKTILTEERITAHG